MQKGIRTTAIVGETIVGSDALVPSGSDEERGYLRGFNTYHKDGDGGAIVSSINGVVEVTDCVVSVRGLSPKYIPEIGDVVVGVITDVAGNRWRVEAGSMQDAVMLLSNVTEPGGILRRRGRDDELTMRRIFKEDDVVVAEVQRISPDGLISLHTRTAEKYGKMSSCGRLVRVKPSLIRRTRHQFQTFLTYGVHLVVGMNGFVWVEIASQAQIDEAVAKRAKRKAEADSDDSGDEGEHANDYDSLETPSQSELIQNMSVFANCVDVLGRNNIVVYGRTILAAVQFCLQQGWKPYDALRPEYQQSIVRAAKDSLLLQRKRRRQ